MKIKYLGHSAFLLTDSAGTSVVCDPYDPSVGFAMQAVAADAVTLSHHHYDHDYVEAVGGNPVVFDKARSYTLGGVEITAIKSYHDGKKGALRGENIIYKYRMDGLDICHMGDLGEECSPALVAAIAHVNVLLIPVGGNYTIDARQAKAYVDAIRPDAVIPMHYSVKGGKIDIDNADKFLAQFDGDSVEYAESEIELTRDGLGGKTRVIVMRRSDK